MKIPYFRAKKLDSEIQAMITASFILVLLSHLNKHDGHRGSVIRLKERLIATLKKKPLGLAKLATEAYDYVKDEHKDKKLELDIGIVIMNLSFNKPIYLQEHFGMDILMLVERAVNKITLPNLTEKQGRDSYDISDILTRSIELHTFKYIKGINEKY